MRWRSHPQAAGLAMAGGMALVMGLFAAYNLSATLSGGAAAGAAPGQQETRALMVYYLLLPRLAVSLLAGAALGLSGAILQRLLRNPLAEPSTLGVSAGAYLALAVATLFAPALALAAPELVTFAGALAALGAVLMLSWRKSLSPITVTLSGLIVSLYCSAVSSVLALFFHEFLAGQILWGAGFLDQQDWSGAQYLWPRLLVAAAAAALLMRPLSIMALGDENARSLGLPLAAYRLLALVVAAGLAAVATSAVGIIGFIGLAAPTLARAAGVRMSGSMFFWSGLMGALLLATADQIVQSLPVTFRIFPTGAVTGLLGAPLLFLLIRRLKMLAPQSSSGPRHVRLLAHPGRVLAAMAGLSLLAAWIALGIGRGVEGWSVALLPLADLFEWRAPRVLAAFSGGAMLALAGAILQRTTGNALASPEVLGVSSGAILSLICFTLLSSEPTRTAQIAAGGFGAFAVLALMRLLSRQPGFSGDRLLLIGIALGSVSSFITAVLMVSQDPRLNQLLAWLSGSTYAVSGGEALLAAGLLGAGLACVPLVSRWLDLLPLGEVHASARGMRLNASRNMLFTLASALTAGATMLVGPLSFAGLMGPHLARLVGFQRAGTHLFASALAGGLILLLADWIGRNILFPFQVPAGLLAALVGGPFLLYLIGRRAGAPRREARSHFHERRQDAAAARRRIDPPDAAHAAAAAGRPRPRALRGHARTARAPVCAATRAPRGRATGAARTRGTAGCRARGPDDRALLHRAPGRCARGLARHRLRAARTRWPGQRLRAAGPPGRPVRDLRALRPWRASGTALPAGRRRVRPARDRAHRGITARARPRHHRGRGRVGRRTHRLRAAGGHAAALAASRRRAGARVHADRGPGARGTRAAAAPRSLAVRLAGRRMDRRRQSAAAARRLQTAQSLRRLLARRTTPRGQRHVTTDTSLYSLRDVRFAVPGRELLHPLTLELPARRAIALIGHNGSGKSTLLKLLARQQPPSGGSISFEGEPLARWSDRAFARKVAYLPQSTPDASGMLVRDLVALGRYPWHGALGRYGAADRRKVAEAIELTDIGPYTDRLVDTLSGGERQRVWLAMLVAQDAQCLLLDEPISALDIAHQVDVLSLVHRLAREKGVAVVVVLHDVNMAARFCDEIIALHGGAMIARGTPDAIMQPEALRRIYGIPMEVLTQHATGKPVALAC